MSGPMPDDRQQLAEVLAAGDVAPDPVGQLARPVPADRARQVALLVGGRVDVDLDEADVRVVEMRERPFAVDQGVLGGVSVVAHAVSLLDGWAVAAAWLIGSAGWVRGGELSRPRSVGRGG